MPGRATPEYPDTGKPKQEFTAVQQRAVFEERIHLEVRRLPCGSLGVVLSPSCCATTTHCVSLSRVRANGGRMHAQNHHEANLPSQRYRERNKLPPTRNPIVATHIHGSMMPDDEHVDGFTRAMDEVNARSRQPLPTSNPLFGYSVHRPPAVMETGSPEYSEISRRSETPASTTSHQSTSSKARMAELQQKIHEERKERMRLETLLATPVPKRKSTEDPVEAVQVVLG